jgi:branched-chain amino acid transport system substrate-binding protein
MAEMPESIASIRKAPSVFNGKTHQVFGHQYISRVENGRLVKVHTTSIEDTLYPDEVDYTTQSL